MAFRPAIFDADIFAFEKAGLPKSVTKRSQIGGRFRWRTRTQESNYPYCLLLRGYRERPCGSRTANKRDELAPPHSITSSARNKSDVGMDIPRACAVRMLSTVSDFVGRSIGSAAGSAPRATLPARTPASRYTLGRSGP